MENLGEQFLHERNPRLHTSPSVEHEKKRRSRGGEVVSERPSKKISNWLDVVERTHMGHADDPRVIERVKDYYHTEYVIKQEDVPEKYFENQRRMAREQGRGDIEITDELRQQSIEVIRADQESTLDNWVDYFVSSDSDSIPMWAKYWAFTGMLKLATYDKEKHAFRNRGKDTVAPFVDLNREALAYVIDAVVKKANKEEQDLNVEDTQFKELLQRSNFGKLYAWAIEKVTPAEENELLNVDGEWVTYKANSDHMPLVQSLQGHGTGWCTAGEQTAKIQLNGGDFHVYYTYDSDGKPTIPRIAIRMEDSRIAEVRGVAQEQNLDPVIVEADILGDKLKEFGTEGDMYTKKTSDMKRLTEINKKCSSETELTVEDLRFLYEFDSRIEGFGYSKDPRIKEITSKRNTKRDLSVVTGYEEHEISLTEGEASNGGIKYHHKNLNLRILSSIEGLALPDVIGGDLDLSHVMSLKGRTLSSSVGGDLWLGSLIHADDLVCPKFVGGFVDLNNLEYAENLTLPSVIGGTLGLRKLAEAKDLSLPNSVGDAVVLSRLKSTEGLTLPKNIGGDLYLNDVRSVEGLEFPISIGGYLYLYKLRFAEIQPLRMKYPQFNIITDMP